MLLGLIRRAQLDADRDIAQPDGCCRGATGGKDKEAQPEPDEQTGAVAQAWFSAWFLRVAKQGEHRAGRFPGQRIKAGVGIAGGGSG